MPIEGPIFEATSAVSCVLCGIIGYVVYEYTGDDSVMPNNRFREYNFDSELGEGGHGAYEAGDGATTRKPEGTVPWDKQKVPSGEFSADSPNDEAGEKRP